MNDPNIFALVDTKAIDAANADLTVAKSKLDAASQAHADASQAHAAAGKAAQTAIEAGSTDALTLHGAHEAGASRVQVAERVLGHAAGQHRAAMNAVEIAKGDAHKPVLSYAVELRIAAARKADQGRAAIIEAEAEHAAATEIMHFAIGQGAPDMTWGNYRKSGDPVTFAHEVQTFGVDYHRNWWPGLNADGSVKGNG
jgi:hypothetical protein